MQKKYTAMKTRLISALVLLTAILSSCNKDDPGAAKVTFRKANIAGSQMLALAQGTGHAALRLSVRWRLPNR